MSLTHTPTPNASGSPSCCNNQKTPLGFAVSPKVFVSSQNENHSWLCVGYLPSLFGAVVLNRAEISKPLMAEYHL